MTKTMSPRTEAAYTSVLLALVTAPAGDYNEAGEMAEHELEKIEGVGLPQLGALAKRGLLVVRRGKMIPAAGPYAGEEISGIRYYSVA